MRFIYIPLLCLCISSLAMEHDASNDSKKKSLSQTEHKLRDTEHKLREMEDRLRNMEEGRLGQSSENMSENMSDESESIRYHLEQGRFNGMRGREGFVAHQWGEIFAYPELMLDFARFFQNPHNLQMKEQEKNHKQVRVQLITTAFTLFGVIVTAIPTYIKAMQGDPSCNCSGV